MTIKQIVESLLLKSEKDTEAAKDLFKLKHYDWSLFIWHLAIEKILKAKTVSLDEKIIYTHDLVRLAKKAKISLNKSLMSQLNEITTFNIEARYDDYKLSFYKKANKEYAEEWSEICEKIYLSIKKN